MVLVRRRRPLLGLDPAQAYIEARVTSVEKGIVRAEASDGRTFDVDLQLPLKPPSRKQKELPRRSSKAYR